VNTDRPEDHFPEPLQVRPDTPFQEVVPVWAVPQHPPRFQHRYGRHIVLLLLTLLTTTMAGACQQLGFEVSMGTIPQLDVNTFAEALARLLHAVPGGLTYAVPLLLILGAHEFGHYAYCRIHQVDATLPYFLPFPIAITGTLGAVIRIKEAFPSKRALFDIGVAGPIAGFVALLPFLWWGITLSGVVKLPEDAENIIYFGEPLLLKAVAWLHFGPLPDGFDIVLHPMGFAAWFGMLATALNLLPFGQLDGGHIAYAVFGRRAAAISAVTLVTAVLLFALESSSWFFVALMMVAMAFLLGLRHPRIIDEDTPLDARRVIVAIVALVIFVICFTPVPIETFLDNPAG
jgi:membrane-associated protease RseP (regulator of RpoE activity)